MKYTAMNHNEITFSGKGDDQEGNGYEKKNTSNKQQNTFSLTHECRQQKHEKLEICSQHFE